jgi:hypothetical protein
MQLRETSDRKRAASARRNAEVPHHEARTADPGRRSLPLTLVSTPAAPDAASSSHAGLLDIARTLLVHLQYCNDCPDREYLVLNACVVRLHAALAVRTYPYLLDSCADDLAAQIVRIQTGGSPCSARRLPRVG